MNLWEQIRDRISVREVAEGYGVELHGSKATCPWCSARLAMSVQVDFFKCHHAGCEARGDVFAYVALQERTDRWGAAKLLADHLGLSFVRTPEAEAREQRSESLKALAQRFSPLPTQAREYLHGRGLTDDYIERRLLGYVPQDYSGDSDPETGLPGLLRGRVLIPFWQGSQVVYFTGRAIDDREPKYCNQRGPKAYIGTMRGPELIVTEGIFDQLLADQARHHCIGLAGSGGELRLHAGVKRVLLAMDADAQGAKYVDRYAPMLAAQGAQVEIVKDFGGVKDLAEYIAGGGDVAALPHVTYLQYAMDRLTAAPGDHDLKVQVYQAIARLDVTERGVYFAALKVLYGCSIPDVKAEFKQYTAEDRSFSQGYYEHEGIRYKLPYGFSMDEHGIRNATGITVSRKPIIVTLVLHDRVERDNYANIVTWFGDRQISKVFSMSYLSSRREIVKLKKYNFPITSENAGDIVTFLNELIYDNTETLKEKNASSQLGWHHGDFIFPHVTVTKDGQQHPVHYLHDSPSPEVFERLGDPEALIQIIRDMKTDLQNTNYVIPIFDIYATLASFLLEPMHQASFVIHHFCESRHGKTLLLKLCAAIIGNPNKQILTWDSTYQFYSRTAAKYRNIPLFINEGSTRITDQKREIEKIIYMLAEGKSKGRALQDSGGGTAKIAEFNLVSISNGEIAILPEQSQTGSEMRVIEFDRTFGEINPVFIAKLEKVLNNNYGLGIEKFVAEVMNTDLDAVPLFHTFPHENGGNAEIDPKVNFLVSKRNQLQPVYAAGIIAEKIFQFGYDPKEIVSKVFDQIAKDVQSFTGIIDSFIPFLRDFVNQYQRNFLNLLTLGDEENAESKFLTGEVFGYIRDDDLCIVPSVFNDKLIKSYNGGDSRAAKGILLELKNRKLIDVDGLERNCRNIRIGKFTRRFIYFSDFFDDIRYSNKMKGITDDLYIKEDNDPF